MSENTVPTNAGPDAVSGLTGKPVWSGDGQVNAEQGENISTVETDPEPQDAPKPAKKAVAKKVAAPKAK